MSMAIIANPLAGRGRSAKTAHLTEKILSERNIDFQLVFTKHRGHAAELAQKASREHEVIAAIGGDGTIREVLEGMWQTSSVLGIIPGGTGNDYARSLGIPAGTAEAIETLLGRSTVLMDVGRQNDRIFGVLASIGFPVDVIEYVNARQHSMLKGKLAFLSAIAATVRNLKSFPVKITADGQSLEENAVGLFIMNMPYGGGGMNFTPEARFNDGVFNLLVIGEITRTDLALTLPKIYSGGHTGHPAIKILKGREFSVQSDLFPIMLDGDVFPAKPFGAVIIPGKTRIIVPKA